MGMRSRRTSCVYMNMCEYRLESVFLNAAGALLEPDDITFSTLVRGYGEAEPPQWAGISTVLGVMQQRFGMRPGTGARVDSTPPEGVLQRS